METFIGFAAIVMTTIVALFGALALEALLLRGVFALMQPATAPRRMTAPRIERGTQLLVRAYSRARGQEFPGTSMFLQRVHTGTAHQDQS